MTYAVRSITELTMTDIERFKSYLPPWVPGECSIWPLMVRKMGGYGRFTPTGTSVHYRAHRLVYELQNGPLSPGLTVDHLCRNRACVNPEHLEAVDNWTNVRRGESPVAKNARKTHCKRGHEFTPENTYVPPKRPTQRNCRACKRQDRDDS